MWRAPLALCLGLAGLLPAAARADLVYVLNSADASISVLESTTREEVRRIPVLREVHHLILSPDRTELMVGDSAGNEMLYLDPDTAEVRRREKFSNPYHMELSPDGKLLVVTSLRRDQVDIYEAATRTLLARLRVPDKPSHLAYTPDSRIVFVTLQGARGLMAIDLATYKPLWTAEVGPQPAGVTWHNGKLLVGVMGSDHVAVVNPADGKVERIIPAARGAHTVFPSPDRKLLYVNSRVDSRITVLDGETLEQRASWPLPGGPDCIAFDPQGRLWVTLRWIARVAIIDPATGETDTVPVGRSPHGIWVQPRATPLPALPVAEAAPPPAESAVVPARAERAAPAQQPAVWRRMFGR
ncbi:YVTN family beta-propeller repeat protein [Paracraurococcus lichenis]|uniref:YncE family protein n=1 Tax=Paracraurococcus lichenis TaxID=3064888 RepID=A0ABT9DVR8_9PROT|nr:YncE family protein [Paracraurococcus sp. LOR1-02]MDO9707895.1 YncE family protein [Paracraurococcus sp. LOR1-02]